MAEGFNPNLTDSVN